MAIFDLADVPSIIRTIAILVDALSELGEPVEDLKAATDVEVARIGAQQKANEEAARKAMGFTG
jgi:uncharacterized protein YoxC